MDLDSMKAVVSGINLKDALINLSAKSITDRASGLNDLRRCFDTKSRSSWDSLSDRAFNKIFDALFQNALTEKKLYVDPKKGTTQKASMRLSTNAEVMQNAVKAGAAQIKRKTAESTILRINEVIYMGNGHLCEPLAGGYLKALHALLEYSPHVEHLSEEHWNAAVDFCLTNIEEYRSDHDATALLFSRGREATPSSRSHTPIRTASSMVEGAVQKKDAEVLLECLHCLIASPNAPVLAVARRIFSAVTHFLHCQALTINPLHQVAFAIINILVSATAIDDISLTQSIGYDVIPIISRLWASKVNPKDEMLNAAKDEMLITLLTINLHVERLLKDGEMSLLEQRLKDLRDTLSEEYARRQSKDQLQLDDISFTAISSNQGYVESMQVHSMSLKPHIARSERKWALLHILGILERLLQERPDDVFDSLSPYEGHSRKRRKINLPPDNISERLKSDDVGTRITTLQLLPFMLQCCQLSPELLAHLLNQLTSCTLDKREDISSWAMVAITSCAYQTNANNVSFDWTQLAHSATRSITMSTTCRAACHLLHTVLSRELVVFRDIAEDVNAIFTTTDLSGPVALWDSSLMLMAHLLHMRNREVATGSSNASYNTIRWLSSKWNPADKLFTSFQSRHVHAVDIVNLLRAALRVPRIQLMTQIVHPSETIGQYWRNHLQNEEVIQFLLLLDAPTGQIGHCYGCPAAQQSGQAPERSSGHSAKRLILELILPKFQELARNFTTYDAEQVNQISQEVLRSLSDSCILGSLLLPLLIDHAPAPSASDELEVCVQGMGAFLVNILADATDSSIDEVVIQTLHPYLPNHDSSDLALFFHERQHLVQFFSTITSCLQKKRLAAQDVKSSSSVDLMDMDDFESQQSRIRQESTKFSLGRRDKMSEMTKAAFAAAVSLQLSLASGVWDSTSFVPAIPSSFLAYLKSLEGNELILCRATISGALRSNLTIGVNDASSLLRHFGEIMMDYEYECCQLTLLLCLDTLKNFANLWLSDESTKLATGAADLYEWFIQVVFAKRRPSPDVLIGLADLLYRLLCLKESFGEELNVPSVRSSLFNVLQTGSSRVKFSIGDNLADIFGLFVLKYHDSILSDLLGCLPEDPECIEGIAFRMFVFARLAARWPTILRRCVYHIFEIPGSIPAASNYARRCLLDLSTALDLEEPQELFKIFAPQLLYTWLETQPIHEIPYDIFGYSSLLDLLQDMRQEATGLMIMRNQDDAVEQLAAVLGTTTEQLLLDSFSKIMGYSIASDISVPRADDSHKYVSGEARVRKRLGKDVFFESIGRHFAEIVAIFFQSLDQDRGLEKSFAKDQALSYAGVILNDIKEIGSSETELPPGQQPTFRAKYLGRELQHLCGRTDVEMAKLYSPAMVVFVARRLLDAVHPALGSQHSCSVIRKLRVLIALAGPEALQGYPIEMLLRSVRPFVTNVECVDDALGIVQYLIQRGSTYLSQFPSFVAGISVSLLVSLRIFMESSQDSTTQELQYKETLSRAHKFHKWFGKWLANYRSPQLSGASETAFQSMVAAAHGIRTVGNAEPGTSESSLLLEILEDERSGRHLLDQPSRDLAFALLCSDFERPGATRHDVLGSDSRAIEYAPVLWKFCRNKLASKSFLSWAGRVIGKSFVSTGQVESQFLQESDLSQFKTSCSSRGRILQLVQALTLGGNASNVGLAEAALRVIISSVESSDEADTDDYTVLSEQLLHASVWLPYMTAPSDYRSSGPITGDPFKAEAILTPYWLRNLTITLSESVPSDFVLAALPSIIYEVDGFAEDVFPFVLHQVLSSQLESHAVVKRQLSSALSSWLQILNPTANENLRQIINAVLYLRTQPLPRENSSADRLGWLEINFSELSKAALRCGMFKTALLFTEIFVSETSRTSRRSSLAKPVDQSAQLLSIYKNIDDPDVYYGVQQDASLSSILARLEYEQDGIKSLSFRGAQFDNHLRTGHPSRTVDAQSLVGALSMLSLDGLAGSVLQTQSTVDLSMESIGNMFRAARKLEQWDIPVPSISEDSSPATIYKAFQAVNSVSNHLSLTDAIDDGLRSTIAALGKHSLGAEQLRSYLQSLAILTELDEVMASRSAIELEEAVAHFQSRSSWMKTGRFEDVSHIISCRETALGSLSRSAQLRHLLNVSMAESRLCEVQTVLLSSRLHRAHGALQESLVTATRLTDLVESCQDLGLDVAAAIHMEAANALWEQGEISTSIGMLKALEGDTSLKKQAIPVGKSDLLARIGYQVSVARLEKADRIMDKYLTPALRELRGRGKGSEAGQVFHEFAVFCDKQLQDADNLEDLDRLQKLKQMKESEVADLTRMYKNASTEEQRYRYRTPLAKAKQWLDLDNQEYRRLSLSRDDFLRQCLENYLLALIASDEHNSDALRFSALWLEHSGQVLANDAVSKHLENVPTRKFASLMNQLSSRLLDNQSAFQKLLFSLVAGICSDHPYHGMYQIWAGFKSKSNSKDGTAVSRQTATKKVAKLLAESQTTYEIWTAIDHTNKAYCQLAAEKYKAGQKPSLQDSSAANSLNNLVQRYSLPPPTMHVEISSTLDYSGVPRMTRLEHHISIASGVSAPKIITVVASNGVKFKQLVKGGNDDLRQDAIMEQVFSQVSDLLKTNRSTRQRNLGIRTYKVQPLTSVAGIIEFVPNTIPLHEYLMPAHERYYPKDLRGSQCRKEIGEVQQQKLDVKVKRFRSVTERFHPVMRYFFMENFEDPDEWFAKRLAYTRSTAAISMLGHVLGLGDRHGHNILLDEGTGEAVHIDLGVAFEMGRVLPVPEVVPFRLTRDIVDGMGITKTEGVFRRCCEFTLEALRKESYSIMTILDVLRYDPLYSWSISPVRLAKLQDAQSAAPVAAADGVRAHGVLNEPSEADRALTVVNKKLSKTLSVAATVNDLINQATDERNLAALFSGWAAYA